jgi:hypothetical protein
MLAPPLLESQLSLSGVSPQALPRQHSNGQQKDFLDRAVHFRQ